MFISQGTRDWMFAPLPQNSCVGGLIPSVIIYGGGSSTRRLGASQVALVVKNLLANAGDIWDLGSIPGSGRFPGGGHDNPLQYSCLENPIAENPVGLHSMGLQRAGNDKSDWACTCTRGWAGHEGRAFWMGLVPLYETQWRGNVSLHHRNTQ